MERVLNKLMVIGDNTGRIIGMFSFRKKIQDSECSDPFYLYIHSAIGIDFFYGGYLSFVSEFLHRFVEIRWDTKGLGSIVTFGNQLLILFLKYMQVKSFARENNQLKGKKRKIRCHVLIVCK